MSSTTIQLPETLHVAPSKNTSWARAVVPAICAALVIRIVVVFFTYRSLPDVEKFYEAFGWEMGWIARALASGHGFSSPYHPWTGPTAMQPPFYPWVVSLVFRVFGVYSLTSAFVVLSMNSVLSSLTCIPIYFSARYSLGSRNARVAAWVWALYPFAIYFSATRVWEYSLTVLLFTTSFCIAQRIHQATNGFAWLGWGALAGITALSNPSTLSVLPFLVILALYRTRAASRPWFVKGLLTCIATVAVLTPWTVRNYRAVGILCPVRDNFWLELYDDNGGDESLDPSFAHPASNPVEMDKFVTMGERAFLAEKHLIAMDYLHQHPEFMVHKTMRRMVYYWTGYWSFSARELGEQPYEPFNVFYVCVITFFMLRGGRRLWRLNRMACLPYAILICVFPFTYYITHPLMDYRHPIEPAILVLAVCGALPKSRLSESQSRREAA